MHHWRGWRQHRDVAQNTAENYLRLASCVLRIDPIQLELLRAA